MAESRGPAWLRDAIGARRSVVTLDNHYVHGGQGEMLAAAIAALGLEPAGACTRSASTSLPECGTNDEVLRTMASTSPALVTRSSGAWPRCWRRAQLT